MTSLARTAEPTELILELVRSMKVPVGDLLRVTRQRIEETHREVAQVLTAFLANRAESKNSVLARAAGEAVSADYVSKLLSVGRAAVHKAKDEGRLLAFQEPGKRIFSLPCASV